MRNPIYVLRLVRRGPDGVVETHWFSTAPHITAADDDPPQKILRPRLLPPAVAARWQRVAGSRAALMGRSTTEPGQIVLANADRRLDAWLVDGGTIADEPLDVLRVDSGRVDEATTILAWTGGAVRPIAEGRQLAVEVRSIAASVADRPLRPAHERYWGLGPALRLDGVDDYVAIEHDGQLGIRDVLDVDVAVRPRGSGGGVEVLICAGRCLDDGAWGLYLHPSGGVRWRLNGASASRTLTGPVLERGRIHRLRGVYDARDPDAVRTELWVDGDRVDHADLGTFELPRASTEPIVVGRHGPQSAYYARADVCSLRIWAAEATAPREAAVYRAQMHRRLRDDEVTEPAAAIAFDDGFGDVAYARRGALQGQIHGDAEWSSSLTGGPELQSAPWPTALGWLGYGDDGPYSPSPRCGLVTVDAGQRIYQVHGGNGERAPLQGIVVDAGGQVLRMQWRERPLTVDAEGRTLTVVEGCGAGLFAGADIRIDGGPNEGRWTVARDSTARTIQLTEPLVPAVGDAMRISTVGATVRTDQVSAHPREARLILDGLIDAARLCAADQIVLDGTASNEGTYTPRRCIDAATLVLDRNVVDEPPGREVIIRDVTTPPVKVACLGSDDSSASQIRLVTNAPLAYGFAGVLAGARITIGGHNYGDGTYTVVASAPTGVTIEPAQPWPTIDAGRNDVRITVEHVSSSVRLAQLPARFVDHALDDGLPRGIFAGQHPGAMIAVTGGANAGTHVVAPGASATELPVEGDLVAAPAGVLQTLQLADPWEARSVRVLDDDEDLDRGLIQLAATPSRPLAARVWTGDVTAADLVRRLVGGHGGRPDLLDKASLDRLAVDAPHALGRWIGSDESVTVGDLLDELAQSISASWGGHPKRRKIVMHVLPDPATAVPDWVVRDPQIFRIEASVQPPPPASVALQGMRNAVVLTADQVAGVVTRCAAWAAHLARPHIDQRAPDGVVGEGDDPAARDDAPVITWHTTRAGLAAEAERRLQLLRGDDVVGGREVLLIDVVDDVLGLDWATAVVEVRSARHVTTTEGKRFVLVSVEVDGRPRVPAVLWG